MGPRGVAQAFLADLYLCARERGMAGGRIRGSGTATCVEYWRADAWKPPPRTSHRFLSLLRVLEGAPVFFLVSYPAGRPRVWRSVIRCLACSEIMLWF